jgi:hypothetical protein
MSRIRNQGKINRWLFSVKFQSIMTCWRRLSNTIYLNRVHLSIYLLSFRTHFLMICFRKCQLHSILIRWYFSPATFAHTTNVSIPVDRIKYAFLFFFENVPYWFLSYLIHPIFAIGCFHLTNAISLNLYSRKYAHYQRDTMYELIPRWTRINSHEQLTLEFDRVKTHVAQREVHVWFRKKKIIPNKRIMSSVMTSMNLIVFY